MTIEHNIFAPTERARSALEEAIRREQRRYWQVRAELDEQFKIENIRFAHDPNWRSNAVSIQHLCDLQVWVGELVLHATVLPDVWRWAETRLYWHRFEQARLKAEAERVIIRRTGHDAETDGPQGG